MTTAMDTTIPQQHPFLFRSTQALAMPNPVEIGQVAAHDAAGFASVPFLVRPELVGPVFIQDTEGSVSVR